MSKIMCKRSKKQGIQDRKPDRSLAAVPESGFPGDQVVRPPLQYAAHRAPWRLRQCLVI